MQHLIPRPPGIAFCTFTKASDASERTHLSAVSSPWGKDDLSSDEDFFLQPRGDLSIKDRYTACVHLPFAGTYLSHPLVSETVSKRFSGFRSVDLFSSVETCSTGVAGSSFLNLSSIGLVISCQFSISCVKAHGECFSSNY